METNYKALLQEYLQRKHLQLPSYSTKRVGGQDNCPLWQSVITFNDGRKYKGSIGHAKGPAEQLAAQNAYDAIVGIGSDTQSIDQKPIVISSSAIDRHPTIIPAIANQDLDRPSKREINERSIVGSSHMEQPTIDRSSCGQSRSNSGSRDERSQARTLTSRGEILFFPRPTVLLIDGENVPNFIGNVLARYQPINLTVYVFLGKHNSVSKRKPITNSEIEIHYITIETNRENACDTMMMVTSGALLLQNKYSDYLVATHDKFGGVLVDIINQPSKIWNQASARLVTSIDHLLK